MAKIKLPFELERPSADTCAVGADAIDDKALGMSQTAINQIAVSGGGSGSGEGNRPGYIILDAGSSFESQVVSQNTIYEIRSAFTVPDEFVMPDNCILKFNGGKLKGGSITGKNTAIDAPAVAIFEDVILTGTWSIDSVPCEWFGAISYGKALDKINEVPDEVRNGIDSADAINKALALANLAGTKAIITGRYYKTESSIVIPRDTTLYISPHSAICPVMDGTGDKICVSGKDDLAITTYYVTDDAVAIKDITTGQNVPKVVALKENWYVATESMAKAIVMDSHGSRIEGNGYILMRAASYTIAIYMKGTALESTDMVNAPYTEVKINDGSFAGFVMDTFDLYSSSEPSNSKGADGDYCIDYVHRLRYKKSAGMWALEPNPQSDGNGIWDWRFNTSMRLEALSPGTSDERIVNLQANLWMNGGFRGVEFVASPSKSWINSCRFTGTNSCKEGGNYFFFGSGSFADIDCEDVNVQIGRGNKAYRIVYGKPWQCNFGFTWDINANNASLREKKVFEFLPSSAWNTYYCEERPRYVSDLGKGNMGYTRGYPYGEEVMLGSHAHNVYNLLQGRTPVNAKFFFTATNKDYSNKANYQTYNSMPVVEDVLSGWETQLDIPAEFPSVLFDEDFHTYVTAIDTKNSLYGMSGLIGWRDIQNGVLRTAGQKYLCVEYVVGYGQSADLYVVNGGVRTHSKLYTKESGEYHNGAIGVAYMPIANHWMISDIDYNDIQRLFIAILPSSTECECHIINIKILATAPKNIYASDTIIGTKYQSWLTEVVPSPYYGKTSDRPNAVHTGWLYRDTDLNATFVNVGDSSNVQWARVNSSPSDADAIPSTGMLPGVMYKLGVVSGSKTWKLAETSESNAEYLVEFETGSSVPTITITGVSWLGGSMPTLNANKKYQVSIVNNCAVIGEF